jgi:rfaE bifunctional protein kinase chain/domain/rfaE bifunctional protein nucleotidyltransferase chain/domain
VTRADAALVDRVLGAARGGGPIAVLGDLILDRWWFGDVERLSREAPAPVVRVGQRTDVPGGAGNTAVNLAAMGAVVRLVGAVGDDEPGQRLLELLAEAGVDTTGVVVLAGLATTAKTRLVGGGQLVARMDSGDRPSAAQRERILAAARRATEGAAAELLCDYGAGAIDDGVRDGLVGRTARPPITVVDAHDLRPWAALAPTVVTPNAGETALLLGTPLDGGPARADAVVAARDQLLAATGAAGVVVTLDRDGTVALTADAEPVRTAARPAPDFQANGAGDTFAAALTLALSTGTALGDAARFAQAAADVVVRERGTSICTAAALRASLTEGAPLLDQDTLAAELDAARASGRRIVFTNGVFDVLHPGHTAYLRQAKQLGDVLVVAVNDDDSVRRLKGPGRPINGVADRAGVVGELPYVDYVTVFGGDTPIPLLERIRPDVYAKGGDYTPEMLAEAGVVQGYGGEVAIVDYVAAHSTSAIIARTRALPGGEAA